MTIDARLDDRGLRLTTEIEPTGRAAVPISFCWHPFVQIPARRAREWELRWPRCERVLVDERVIPTGERVAAAGASARPSPTAPSTITTRSAPTAASRCARGGRSVELPLRPDVSVRAALRARARQLRGDRADDRDDRRARPRHAPVVKPGDRFRAWFTIAPRLAVTLRLLPVGAHTGFLGALCVPDDLYWVSRTPVALAGMSYPGRADWSLLASEGIGHVVCLTHDVAPYDPSPCTVTAFELQDLVSGDPPDDPDREHALVRRRGRPTWSRTSSAASASPCTAWAAAAAPAP